MRSWPMRLLNAALVVAVGVFVWRAVAKHWSELSTADSFVRVGVPWIVAAALVAWLTYFVLIGAWRFVLQGWEQRIGLIPAIRIWCISNLGRYLPGKIWAVAGMAVLAKRHGVDAWAAGGSALVMQVLAVTTGATVVVATLPTISSAEAGALHPALIGVAVILGMAGLGLLMTPAAASAVGKITAGRFQPKPLSLRAVAAGASSTLLSWFSYGLAFWLIARGVLADRTLGLPAATGSFAAGYVIGLIAVIVPGGLGVREGVLFALLAPQLGGPQALVVTAASRLLLSVTEISAALAAALLPETRSANDKLSRREKAN